MRKKNAFIESCIKLIYEYWALTFKFISFNIGGKISFHWLERTRVQMQFCCVANLEHLIKHMYWRRHILFLWLWFIKIDQFFLSHFMFKIQSDISNCKFKYKLSKFFYSHFQVCQIDYIGNNNGKNTVLKHKIMIKSKFTSNILENQLN